MLLHQEIAVSECGCAAVTRAGYLVGAERDDVIAVQDSFQRITVKTVFVLFQGHNIVDVDIVI